MRKIYKITCFVCDHIVTRRVDLLLKHVMKWIQNVLLFSIWVTNTQNFTSSVEIYL